MKFKLLFKNSFIRSLFIQTESTPNPESIKFKPGVSVMSGNPIEFLSPKDALVSPLASSLFRIEGIKSVFFANDFITITKSSDSSWPILKPDIYSSIMDFYSSKLPIIKDSHSINNVPLDTLINETDDEVTATIKELIESRIRPTIMEDGGDLEYCGFKDGIVYLKLKGACRTCESSSVTLKSGIENMMMHYIPEVKAVEQVLDDVEKMSLLELKKMEDSFDK